MFVYMYRWPTNPLINTSCSFRLWLWTWEASFSSLDRIFGFTCDKEVSSQWQNILPSRWSFFSKWVDMFFFGKVSRHVRSLDSMSYQTYLRASLIEIRNWYIKFEFDRLVMWQHISLASVRQIWLTDPPSTVDKTHGEANGMCPFTPAPF